MKADLVNQVKSKLILSQSSPGPNRSAPRVTTKSVTCVQISQPGGHFELHFVVEYSMALKSRHSDIFIPDNVSWPQYVYQNFDKYGDKTAIVSILQLPRLSHRSLTL